jgi:hypothetical protein
MMRKSDNVLQTVPLVVILSDHEIVVILMSDRIRTLHLFPLCEILIDVLAQTACYPLRSFTTMMDICLDEFLSIP